MRSLPQLLEKLHAQATCYTAIELVNIVTHAELMLDQLGQDLKSLLDQIEGEVLGGPVNLEDMRITHYSNRDRSNLKVTMVVSYLPLGLSSSYSTDEGVNQLNAQELACQKLMDMIWDYRLSEIEGSS